MPLFGAAAEKAQGHVVTTILIGMVAMLFTAISYGRMANAYPSAGSAYAYVSREIHPALGYFVGWGMIFDYVMNPIICVIWCSKAAINFVPEIPFAAYAVSFAVLFTAMNLRGIEASTRTNALLAAVLEKSTEFLSGYARAFKEAGADGLIMAEPAAGLLSITTDWPSALASSWPAKRDTMSAVLPAASGTISLRDAIATANAANTPTTITFDASVFSTPQTNHLMMPGQQNLRHSQTPHFRRPGVMGIFQQRIRE